jgi:hypothetical protein
MEFMRKYVIAAIVGLFVSLTCFGVYTFSIAFATEYGIFERALFERRDSNEDRAKKLETLGGDFFDLFIEKSFLDRGFDFAMVGMLCGIGTLLAWQSYMKRHAQKTGAEHQIP